MGCSSRAVRGGALGEPRLSHDSPRSGSVARIGFPRENIMRATNRWGIAVAAVVIQIALGAVYAWSVFRLPLASQFGWSIPQVTFVFSICIFVVGVAAFFGGLWLNR